MVSAYKDVGSDAKTPYIYNVKTAKSRFFQKKMKKVAEKFGGFRKTRYLCNRF